MATTAKFTAHTLNCMLFSLRRFSVTFQQKQRNRIQESNVNRNVCGIHRNSKAKSNLSKNVAVIRKEDFQDESVSFRPSNRHTVLSLQHEIETLLAKNKLKDALYLFEVQRKDDKIKHVGGMFSKLIEACGQAGYTKKAFSLYNDMKKGGWTAKSGVYTSLFNACANSPWASDGLQRASKLFQQIIEQKVDINLKLYHSMIRAFGRLGDFTMVMKLVKKMEDEGINLTTETFNFMLQSCITLPVDGYKRAIIVWRKMRDLNVPPTLISYNLLLRSARDCGIGESKVKWISHEKLLDQNQLPSLEQINSLDVGNSAVSEYPSTLKGEITDNFFHHSRGNQNKLSFFGGIKGFLKQMEENQIAPDIKTITLMLDAANCDRNQEKVLIEYADKKGIDLDVDFFNILIKRRILRKDSCGVTDVLNALQRRKLQPNIITFGVLAMGCRSHAEADALLKDMENANFRPNVEIFGSLLSTAIAKKNCGYIIYLLNRTVEWNLTVDEKAVKMLENFKEETKKCIGRSDRGELAQTIYGQEKFQKAFRSFCFTYERWLKESSVVLNPHPWQQYRL